MEQQQPRPTPSLSSKDLKLTDETFALYRHAVIGESVKSGHGEARLDCSGKNGKSVGGGLGPVAGVELRDGTNLPQLQTHSHLCISSSCIYRHCLCNLSQSVYSLSPTMSHPPLTIAITGGAGHVGSAVVDTALSDGHTVVAIDLPPTGKLTAQERYTYRSLDCMNYEAFKGAVEGCDTIIHLAAIFNTHDGQGNTDGGGPLQNVSERWCKVYGRVRKS